MESNSTRELALVVACSNMNIKVEQVKLCKLSYNLKSLAVLMQDGTLKINSLDRQGFTTVLPMTLKDFKWHNGKNCDKLIGITNNDQMFTFSLCCSNNRLGFTELQYDVHNLQYGDLDEIKRVVTTITLLDYHKEKATLYLNNCVSIVNLESSANLSLQGSFKLNNRGEVCDEGFHIVQPYMFVIWICGIIDVYDLFFKRLKIIIDLNAYLPDVSMSLLSKSCRFSFSNDLDYFVFLNEKGSVYKVNLTAWISDLDLNKIQNQFLLSSQTKAFKKVSGFSKSMTGSATNTSVIIPLLPSRYSVKAFKGATEILYFWESDEKFGKIVAMDIDNQTLTTMNKLEEQSFVIFAENCEMPHLLLTEDNLYALVHDYSSEDMINKFMFNEAYLATAHAAKLNNWKLLFISQDVLAACIKNRYLDAVIYYLENHEFDKETITKLSSAELNHFEGMLILLKTSIRQCYSEAKSKQFGKQLLKILLDYLIRLLKIVVMTNSVNILNMILDNLNDIRGLLDDFPRSIERPGDSINEVSQLWREWLQLDKLNFIRSGIQNKYFSVVQTFYLHNYFDNFNLSMDDSPLNEWQMILEPLKTGDVTNAVVILNKMGLDAHDKLKYIYYHTFNDFIRKHLEEYFIIENGLHKEDLDLVHKFKNLQELYPCQSIKKSLETSYKLKLWKSESLNYLKSLFESCTTVDVPDINYTSAVHLGNKTLGDSCNYSCLIIQWTKCWKGDMWDRVFIESLIVNPVERHIESIDIHAIWEYLIAHNRVDVIKASLNDNSSFYFGKLSILKKLKKSSTWRAIIEKVPNQIPHVASNILDELSKIGLFSGCELSNFSLLLKRLGRIYEGVDQLSSILSSSPMLSINLFHIHFIKYCLEYDLPTVLWQHIDQFNISKDLLLSVNSDISSGWLKVMTYFKNWERNFNENNAVILASISNYEYTLQSVYSTDDIFISGLINLINSLYQPENIKSVIETNNCELRKDVVSTSGITKDDWSFLYEIIFSLLNNDDRIIQDTSVYELLKENLPLDLCHLFGWQTSNNLKTFDGFNELPYFSHPELVKKFGFTQELEFTYYLKQGRPLFAYIKCVSYCASVFGKVTSSQISRFCNLAHAVAIENVGLPLVSSSCVVFMELLSCNTQGVRIDLEILQLIFWYQDVSNGQLFSENRNLVEFIENGFYKQKDKILILIQMAEVSISHFITVNSINIIDSIYYWSILNIFCQRHEVGNSLHFLKMCAEFENWILFLIFAEMFQYSRDQIWLIICQQNNRRSIADVHFSNMLGQLRFHSQSSIGRKFTAATNNPNQARLNFYSKVCVNAISKNKVSISNSDDASDSVVGESSDEMSDQSSTSNNQFMGEFSTFFDSSDFLITILRAHKHACPWQILLAQAIENNNSTLVIIAACYQGSSLLECFCIWIMTSVSGDVQTHVNQMLSISINTKSWTFDIILDIICYLLKSGLVNILVDGFNYFLPESPLHTFLIFLKFFLIEKDYENSLLYLKEFLSSLNDCQNLNFEVWDSELCIEDFCTKAINEVLLFLVNRWERIAFLNILCNDNFEEMLNKKGTGLTKYSLISKIEELLSLTNCSYNIKNLLLPNQEDLYIKECKTILNSLIEEKYFEIAEQFVILTDYPKYEMLIAQANIEVQSRLQYRQENIKNLNPELLFWKQYYFKFKQFDVPSKESFLFFKKFGLIVKDPLEKYFILRLGWLVCTSNGDELLFENDIEAEMWLARIKAEIENEKAVLDLPNALFDFQFMNKNQMKTSHQIFYEIRHCNPIFKTCPLQTEKEKSALDKILRIELEQGNVDVAHRLTLLFDHSCTIVSIVLECMQLAENYITSEDNKEMISESKSKDLGSFVARSDSVQFDSKARLNRQPSGTSSTTSEDGDILKILNKYADHYHLGGFALNRVIIFYKLSLIFKESYVNILTWSSYKLLKTILQKTEGKTYVLMKALISAIGLDDNFLAPFLCDHITETLRFIIDGDLNYDINFSELSNEFLQLAKLCEDASTLGKTLLECLIHQPHGTANYVIEVELCIISHNCYTLACHVEGITKTLQVAKQLTGQLASVSEFTIMVRLLTGMKRFSEMPYIFDILRNNHRFELLFKKGMEKVPGFKLAILDYMKRFHPTDTEMFTMIALHFTMYREIAETLESLAKSQLQNLNIDKLINNREPIEIIAQYLADAAESYFKADCLQHALACCKQAELTALQIYLLQSNIRIINLQSVEVTNFIVNNSNFKEACIVAEAYGHSQDWALALYNNYIIKNDDRYLTEFSHKFKLSVSLIEEIARRFLKETIKSTKMIVNMRNILNLVDDIQIKHDLANELGFTDLSMSLLAEHHILNLQKSL